MSLLTTPRTHLGCILGQECNLAHAPQEARHGRHFRILRILIRLAVEQYSLGDRHGPDTIPLPVCPSHAAFFAKESYRLRGVAHCNVRVARASMCDVAPHFVHFNAHI